MKFEFKSSIKPENISLNQWQNWIWQLQNSLKTKDQYSQFFSLSKDELVGFAEGEELFNIRTTPYYANLADKKNENDPIRKILMPHVYELMDAKQAQLDPLGERKTDNNPTPRIIHRYSDRVLFLVTDICSVYCRYCTRKHFTGTNQALINPAEYELALNYIRKKTGIREVILSGGDPLTLSDSQLDRVLADLRKIEHIEIIRIGSRMPVVCPMRITEDFAKILRKAKPVYVMTHFNHPRELTAEAVAALEILVDHGTPVMNQMVLLNGINNHAAIVQALSRRLLYLRVKPYYMFQCDPSIGTDHLRTTIDNSLEIQKELWGHLSGLAMPNLSLDIPNGGGKAYYVPNFEIEKSKEKRTYEGWDKIKAEYINPAFDSITIPSDAHLYEEEWAKLKSAKN